MLQRLNVSYCNHEGFGWDPVEGESVMRGHLGIKFLQQLSLAQIMFSRALGESGAVGSGFDSRGA